ncbi:hypothetical protein HY440_00590 [Candidatus Microgenomates bacterium]|nr:hypothetical protein [Candidatus Microgenomates bacterium]
MTATELAADLKIDRDLIVDAKKMLRATGQYPEPEEYISREIPDHRGTIRTQLIVNFNFKQTAMIVNTLLRMGRNPRARNTQLINFARHYRP